MTEEARAVEMVGGTTAPPPERGKGAWYIWTNVATRYVAYTPDAEEDLALIHLAIEAQGVELTLEVARLLLERAPLDPDRCFLPTKWVGEELKHLAVQEAIAAVAAQPILTPEADDVEEVEEVDEMEAVDLDDGDEEE